MTSGISKAATRASFLKNCTEAAVTGGKSELEIAIDGASCAVSTVRLIKQECEEGNIPKPYCPEQWRPENKQSERYNTPQDDHYFSEPITQEQPATEKFQRAESAHSCPNCGSKIEFQAVRCLNCFSKLKWEYGKPKVAEEKRATFDTEPDVIGVQSKSSF